MSGILTAVQVIPQFVYEIIHGTKIEKQIYIPMQQFTIHLIRTRPELDTLLSLIFTTSPESRNSCCVFTEGETGGELNQLY